MITLTPAEFEDRITALLKHIDQVKEYVPKEDMEPLYEEILQLSIQQASAETDPWAPIYKELKGGRKR